MKNKRLRRNRLMGLFILSFILLTGAYSVFLMNISTNSPDFSNFNNHYNDYENNILHFPKSSLFGNAPWWDHSFEYRMLINITNPYSYNFVDFGVSLSFNYVNLVQEGKLQSDLDDLRIVENGILRNYYVQKDYPSQNLATIWFDTNVSASRTERDTYLYFGNEIAINFEARDISESFGWIKNGNFELDISTDSNYEPYGWNFSHNPVNTIKGQTNPSSAEYNSPGIELFVNKLISNPQSGERVGDGSYAYKWGTSGVVLPTDTINDYAGTLFTYPFKVPIVEGGAISLDLFRNIRTWRFEKPKTMDADLNVDGYFLRILNGSSSHYNTDPDLHDDSDIYNNNYDNYGEIYDGYSEYNPSSKKWLPLEDQTKLINFDTHTSTQEIKDTVSDTSSDGELTGFVGIDLTQYMGKEVFFEFGVWGDESSAQFKQKSAFFQVDALSFNYTLTAVVNEAQKRRSDITIITRDIDGRIVPNAKVAIVNNSAKGTDNFIVQSGVSSSLNGSIVFNNVLNGVYNITANYTLGSEEVEVYNSTKFNSITHNFTGKSFIVDLKLDLWTIDFEIVDWERLPLKYAYINVSDQKAGTVLSTITLSSQGKTTFRWTSASYYYYEVYYNNEDYDSYPFLVSYGYINRSDYEISKFQTHIIDVDEVNQAPSIESRYNVSEYIYTNGSRITFGNKKIVKANITLTNMNDQIQDISIYYIDRDNSKGVGEENLIYFDDDYGFGDDNDFISLDMIRITNSKLNSENHQVYGLFIEINGLNSTQCNGVITVDLIETANTYNRTKLSKLHIRVISKDISPEGMPVSSLIKVRDDAGQPLINLTSFWERNGSSYGPKNGFELPFWFFIDRTYNFSINYLDNIDIAFNITELDPENQWYPTSNTGTTYYNYTFYGSASITFNLILPSELNTTNYDTAFFNATGTTDVLWGNNMTYSVNFYYTQDGGGSWTPTGLSSSCSLIITEVGSSSVLFVKEMNFLGSGNFSITLNSNLLSAGGSYIYYSFKITGNKPGYPQPNTETFFVRVRAIPTTIRLYDHDSLIEIPDSTINAYYGELVNLTIRYYRSDILNNLLGAQVRYSWIGIGPFTIQPDPINIGYYTLQLNTSSALSTGIKVISISASLENFTTQSNFNIFLDVDPRPTYVNGEVHFSSYPKIWAEDGELFNFIYSDALTAKTLGDLDLAVYSWQQLDENRDPIPGMEGAGTLIELANKSYSLDFNTAKKPIGDYRLFITLQKESYDARFALLDLEIKLREFSVEWEATGKSGNQVSVVQGSDIFLEINLTDTTRNSILTNASLVLRTQGSDYSFTEDTPGYYTMTFNTENIDAFFVSNIFGGRIIIQKDNFTSQEVDITFNILMEEIFPGMPTFYFILITASVAAIAITAIGYRAIQQAKIPKFVKKIRKVKGAIKSKKKITEMSIPNKEELMSELYGEEWKSIGLSLEDIISAKDLKSRFGQFANKITKNGGEND
ncbi:MAG: hypothetical protein ACFFFB_02595 [Candidatus Heimdallarchaeota archaeon]